MAHVSKPLYTVTLLSIQFRDSSLLTGGLFFKLILYASNLSGNENDVISVHVTLLF